MSIPAHTQTERFTLQYAFPAHEPREGDPHYATFTATRKRIEKLGLLKCWICGTTQQCELHHDEVEFALVNGIDWQAFALDHPEWHLLSEDDLREKIECEGNMRVLCAEHHRGLTGIHTVHYSAWKDQKWIMTGMGPFEQAIRAAHG